MIIRPVTNNDREEWLRMRLVLWPDDTPENHLAEIDEIAAGKYAPPISLPQTAFVAERPQGGLGGFLEASLRGYADGCDTRPVGYIEGWFIDEDLRRQGVGAALVAAAEAWARSQGCREMASDCLIDNTPSQQAHLALGYQEAERLIHFCKKIDGEPQAAEDQAQGQFFCSTHSRLAGEQLAATASPTSVFFLIEYQGLWGYKAFEESQIPAEVKAHLAQAAKNIPQSKVLLIKSNPGSLRAGIRFFVVLATETNPALYAFQLAEYEDLLDINLPAVLNGAPEYLDCRQEHPLFLVCTNGKRDLCCAKFGLQAYRSLARLEGLEVWQCSHLGGHRFAANLLILPHGLLYGRVGAENAPAIASAHLRGQLALDHLRGRSSYSQTAQAAEILLRQETGALGLSAFHLMDVHPVENSQWQARFLSIETGRVHRVDFVEVAGEGNVYESCRRDKLTPPHFYRLLEHQVLEEEQPRTPG